MMIPENMIHILYVLIALWGLYMILHPKISNTNKDDEVEDWRTDAFGVFLFNILKNDSLFKKEFPDYLIDNNDESMNSYIHMLLLSSYDDSDEGIKHMIKFGIEDLNEDEVLSSIDKKKYMYLLENFPFFLRNSKERFKKLPEYQDMRNF